ncbi:hypothetical protein E2C01_006465 [Portunus trituberculatus]|uniref:Uncharacterized protein n=1 Tax=Portunus trituberculatus TaxID=210409 RepID=A0A5B7CXY5_PORTR|nr:hypothetical protein [Portunus trituberculatus]
MGGGGEAGKDEGGRKGTVHREWKEEEEEKQGVEREGEGKGKCTGNGSMEKLKSILKDDSYNC